MCLKSVKRYFQMLKERNIFAWFILLIIIVYLVFLAFSPTFRYGDDMRYLATAKTIALTGDLAPKYEMFGDTVFDGPPFLVYVLTILYFVSFGNQFVWFFITKAFMLVIFFFSLFLLNKFCNKYNFSTREKIVAIGLFSFFPASIFTSIAAMQDQIIVLLTMLLFWFLLNDKNNYLQIAVFSGLLILTKITSLLIIASAFFAVIMLRKDNKTKTLLITSMLIGIILINSLWMVRNYSEFGHLLYHHSMNEKYQLFPEENMISKFFYVYMSTWSLQTADYIAGSIKMVSSSVVLFFEVILGLFLLPIFLFLFKNLYKYKKLFLEFIPLIFIMILFTYIYLSVFVEWVDVRHLLPALPFISLIVAKGVNKKKLSYFIICFIIFILISAATNTVIKNKQDFNVSALKNIINNNVGKEIAINDWELRTYTSLYFNIHVSAETIQCNNWEKEGNLFYCITGSMIQISKTIPISSSSS